MKVPAMAFIMDLPREGHLATVQQSFSFLKSKQTRVAVFDPTELRIGKNQFTTEG